jgi:hypothetical protein
MRILAAALALLASSAAAEEWPSRPIKMVAGFGAGGGYVQTQMGYTVKRDMPGREGPEVERLYARGARVARRKAARALTRLSLRRGPVTNGG